MSFRDNPVIRRLAEEREAEEALHLKRAQDAWETMTDNQKTGVRFGLFDVNVIRPIEAEGLWDMKQICVALMDCAKADGGMRA